MSDNRDRCARFVGGQQQQQRLAAAAAATTIKANKARLASLCCYLSYRAQAAR